jgi:hypothetical protein
MDERTTPAFLSDGEIAIALIVHRASDPISGEVTFPHAAPVPFTGWMQLTQLLVRGLDTGG